MPDHEPAAVCQERFANIAKRLDDLEKAEWRVELRELSKTVGKLGEQIANLNGRIAGYLVAGGILGAILSGLVQYVLKK